MDAETLTSGSMLGEYLKMFAALILVLGLISGLALIIKKLGLNTGMSTNGSSKRLKIIERQAIDARRQMVLVQRDDVQHLVIISANGETVIETGIIPADNESHDSQQEKTARKQSL